MRLRFKKMDAFVEGAATGNPAGCVYLETDSLSDAAMQQVARELKGYVNEVGFLVKDGKTYRLRFFSSECEVDFCGHATIGILYDLIANDPILRETPTVTIQVKAGDLPVFNRLDSDGAVFVMAPSPQVYDVLPAPEEIASALGCSLAVIERNEDIALIDAGLRTLIVPMVGLDDCLSVWPDQERLRLFCLEREIDIVLIASEQTAREDREYRTRVFAPKYGYLEDPATGSGNSAFGHYLIARNRMDDRLRIEQGPSRQTPNTVFLRRRDTDAGPRILFGGASLVRVDGTYLLHAF